ncbi:hypothetical protein PHISCL_00419 [Aspergillus sclerotialis]|uniref:NYN domain-containing protein n=1 Tax=Aspergillus sclerotialis TaxID=2070753 RepID=A0A3A2ZVX2_9EURO|nr:hypothetical protein PHISCL_00419 [Aspergillus sclerotialis]
MPPVESSSNWDFTAVIRLLHSPSHSGGDSPIPSHHDNASPSNPGGILNTESSNVGIQEDNVDSAREYPRLGDFTSLWRLLGQAPITPTVQEVNQQCEDGSNSEAPPEKPDAIKILKRPSKDHGRARNLPITEELTAAASNVDPVLNLPVQDASFAQRSSENFKVPKILKRPPNDPDNAESLKTPPPTAPRAIPVPNSSHSRRFRDETKSKSSINDCSIGDKPISETDSSNSGAEAASDSNLSVFDAPLPKKQVTTSLVPPQVGIWIASPDTPPSSYDSVEGTLNPEIVKKLPKTNRASVQPIAYKSAAERKVGLLTKLLKDFPDYAEIVSQVGRPMKNRAKNSSRPIHVFVDISNIMVGFHDTVKESRDIPIKTRIPRLPLSFENFTLILERGRRATKRVLVGSDRFAAIDEAEKIGYETNILDRVYKVKHLTPRQQRLRKTQAPGSQEGFGCSETNGATRERWVEQGVDEILHLKILESLVDTDEPTTIVLATGDAAEAEYSDGFMKMVERALQRGWTVELVSFWQTTSLAYRKEKFRAKWGDQFKMINLEGYIEELLNM